MNTKRIILILIPLILVVSVVYYAMHLNSVPSEHGLKVYVVVPPQAYLAKKIAGEFAEVKVLLGEGKDPHDYAPSPKEVADVCSSQLFFSIGLPVEKTVVGRLKADCPETTVVDSAAGIVRIGAANHEHGAGCGCQLSQGDPHVWLDVENLRIMAENIAEALIKQDPSHADEFKKNLKEVEKELDQLKIELDHAMADTKGNTFYVYHPAFGYFAKAYGLTQKAVEVGGKNPTPRAIEALIANAKYDKVEVIFVQPRFNKRTAEIVAEQIGAKVEELDPLQKDVVQNLRKMAEALGKGSARSQSIDR